MEKNSGVTKETRGIYVSCDRKSTTVRLIVQDGFARYKKELKDNGAFFEESAIETASCSSCSNGYYYVVKGRNNLKEYLCEELDVKPELFIVLLKSVCEILDLCARYKIPPNLIIYDYRAVFVENNNTEIKFLSMPGAEDVQSLAPCVDLVKVFFLHLYEFFSADDYKKGEMFLETTDFTSIPDIKKLLSNMENMTVPYLSNKNNSLSNKIKQFINRKRAINQDNPESKIVTLSARTPAVQICGEGILAGLSVTRQSLDEKNNIIRIGRDEGWSDIVVKDMTASRKHAELSFDSSGKMIVSDMSLNGTKVNGVQLKRCKHECSGKQDVRIMITEQCGVLVKFGKKSENDILEKEIV